MNRDISTFINWFITQFVNIGKKLIEILDSIKIYQSVSLLDLTIAIAILGMFLGLILAIPQNAMNKAEKVKRETRKERTKK